MSDLFTILDNSNSVTITLNNPITGYSESMVTLNDRKSVAWCIVGFARQQNIDPEMVQYSIAYPIEVKK